MGKIFFLLSVMAFAASGRTLHCSDATQNLTYSNRESDGGAPIGPSENLVWDGKTYINQKPLEIGPDILEGKWSVDQRMILSAKWLDDSKYRKLTTFSALGKLTSLQSEVLYSHFVICEERTYHGPPIP